MQKGVAWPVTVSYSEHIGSNTAPTTRNIRSNTMNNKTHCAGCGQSFESYGMDRSEGYNQDGYTYCNSDCQMEAERSRWDEEEYRALSEEY